MSAGFWANNRDFDETIWPTRSKQEPQRCLSEHASIINNFTNPPLLGMAYGEAKAAAIITSLERPGDTAHISYLSHRGATQVPGRVSIAISSTCLGKAQGFEAILLHKNSYTYLTQTSTGLKWFILKEVVL